MAKVILAGKGYLKSMWSHIECHLNERKLLYSYFWVIFCTVHYDILLPFITTSFHIIDRTWSFCISTHVGFWNWCEFWLRLLILGHKTCINHTLEHKVSKEKERRLIFIIFRILFPGMITLFYFPTIRNFV